MTTTLASLAKDTEAGKKLVGALIHRAFSDADTALIDRSVVSGRALTEIGQDIHRLRLCARLSCPA